MNFLVLSIIFGCCIAMNVVVYFVPERVTNNWWNPLAVGIILGLWIMAAFNL